MNVLVVNTKGPFQWGGAELLARSLVKALGRAGVRADLLEVPHFQRPAGATLDAIRQTVHLLIGETNFGPIDLVITLKFPAYLVQHPCKVLWLLHQYRQVYDLWNEPMVGFSGYPEGNVIRQHVIEADTRAMAEHHKRFAISGVVRDRLRRFSGFDAEILYPPTPDDTPLFSAGDDGYLLYPARITPSKRQSLIVEALPFTRHGVRVRFIGGAEVEGITTELMSRAEALGVADRITFGGWVEDHAKRQLLARCRGVIYTPRLEDYGYVPLEAAMAGKPVVTCSDSGGPVELLGSDCCVVAEPDSRALADALDTIWNDAARRSAVGRAARDRVAALGITWPRTVERLLASIS